MTTVGQQSLANFYQSVKFQNPALADEIRNDVEVVALYGLSQDKSGGREAADRLRQKAFDLPVLLERVLQNALEDLGF